MRKILFAAIAVAMITCTPVDASAIGLVADASTTALAPSQRDINIAVLVVLVGSVLVGYERAARERQAQTHQTGNKKSNSGPRSKN